MIVCPQCKKGFDDIKGLAVGWCRLDIHHDCLPLHVRSCQACRQHNEQFVARSAK